MHSILVDGQTIAETESGTDVMQFSELPFGARFYCLLPNIRDPVECKKISHKRFQILRNGEYRTAKPRTMAVIYSHLETGIDTMNDAQRISQVATMIAGSIFEDSTGSLEHRLEQAINWNNAGTDSDLNNNDRDRLRLLLDAATGITADLTDSETGDVIRVATVAEACESAAAGAEGHIDINGRKCYVCL